MVMDSFLTDTADYADIVLPATTQLEHFDVHKSYGHLYVLANNPAIAPVGESLPNSEVFRRLAARMGFDEACFRDTDEDICRARRSAPASPRMARHRLGDAEGGRLAAPGRCRALRAVRRRAASRRPRASASSTARRWRSRASTRCRSTTRPPSRPSSNPALAREYPLAFLSPPARNFLNSSLRQPEALPRARRRAAAWTCIPTDAAARGIRDGDAVRVFNDRGSFTLQARVNGKPRRGVVVAPSVWWKKFAPDGRNANDAHLAAHRRPGRRARPSTTAWSRCSAPRDSGARRPQRTVRRRECKERSAACRSSGRAGERGVVWLDG